MEIFLDQRCLIGQAVMRQGWWKMHDLETMQWKDVCKSQGQAIDKYRRTWVDWRISKRQGNFAVVDKGEPSNIDHDYVQN